MINFCHLGSRKRHCPLFQQAILSFCLKGFMVVVCGYCLLGESVNAQTSLANTHKQRPNIILFLVDDMGWQDCSVPFWDQLTAQNKKFRTPNMERLAQAGLKFTSAYANSICTPSRVSLMTGMNAGRHRVSNWTMFKDRKVDRADSLLEAPDWNVNGISPAGRQQSSVYATTLPEILLSHGYYTIQCGKAHFGAYGTAGSDPLNLGFVKNIGGSAAGNPASYLAEDDFGYDPNHFNVRADIPNMRQYWGEKSFLTEDLTLEAKKAMDTARQSGRPFFLYMAHYAVHLPYDADNRFVQYYLDQGFSEKEAAYCALIEGMDKSLGDLMDYLKENHLDDNTVLLFMSDNGGFSHAPREGKEDTQNLPLRAGKGALYEGGIREPMIVCWPGHTKPGTVCDQPLIIEDYFPTILEIAGIKHAAPVQKIDGISFLPYLLNPVIKDSKRAIIWNFPDGWGNEQLKDYSWSTAIRQGDWKLIYMEKYGKLELYNIRKDIGEQRNVLRLHPAIAGKLAHLLTERLKAEKAQLPIVKKTGRTVPYPDVIFAGRNY